MSDSVDARLKALGIELVSPPPPRANYVPTVESRGFLYISGQLPLGPGGLELAGTCGAGVEKEAAKAAARTCAINILAQAKAALGSLDRVKRVVKLVGFVSSAQGFGDQPFVINGASDLLVEVFGDRGRHARSAIGVAALPFNAAVEVEAVLEID